MQSLCICSPDTYLNYCHSLRQSGAGVTPTVTQGDSTKNCLTAYLRPPQLKRRILACRVLFWPIQSIQSLSICSPGSYFKSCYSLGQSGAGVTPSVTQDDGTKNCLTAYLQPPRLKRRILASRVPFWPIQSMQSLSICSPDPYLKSCYSPGQYGADVTPSVTQCDIAEIALRPLYVLLGSRWRISAS